jgi:CBS domain-containing protein
MLVVSFFIILLALIIINTKVNGGFKIETSWIAIAVSPAIIWLISTGQLAEFSGFGLAFKIKQASAKPFSLKLEGDSIDPASVPVGEKEGMGMIPKLIEQKVSALAFKLNRKGYYNNQAIGNYLEELTQHDFFKYAVFIRPDKSFSGIISAKDLLKQMNEQNIDLVNVIEEGAIDRITGIVTVSVSTTSPKRDALKIMEGRKLSELPVVNEIGQFIGIVERDKLTSSILLQLISQL